MTIGKPLVSVIIPTYNDGKFIFDAVMSVKEQTYRPIEIIIIDSSDVDSIRDFAVSSDDITYLVEPPNGPSAARNAGLDVCTGEIIAFLDADDIWLPTKLERQVDIISSGVGFVYSDTLVEGDGGHRHYLSTLSVHDPQNHYVRYFRRGGIPCCTVAISRDCLKGRRFDTGFLTVEDRHLWVRLLRTCSVQRIPKALTVYRRRANSATSNVNKLFEDEMNVIDDLTRRYPELEPFRNEVEAIAEYKRGKRLLRQNERFRAIAAITRGIRLNWWELRFYFLLFLALVPLPTSTSIRYLERAVMIVRRRIS